MNFCFINKKKFQNFFFLLKIDVIKMMVAKEKKIYKEFVCLDNENLKKKFKRGKIFELNPGAHKKLLTWVFLNKK